MERARRSGRGTRRGMVLAGLTVASLLGSGCQEDTIPIRDLLANTARYDGETVRVDGEVESSAGAFGYGVYRLDDGTGEVTVITKRGGAPIEKARVGVEGTFRSAFTLGTDVIAVIEESKRVSR